MPEDREILPTPDDLHDWMWPEDDEADSGAQAGETAGEVPLPPVSIDHGQDGVEAANGDQRDERETGDGMTVASGEDQCEDEYDPEYLEYPWMLDNYHLFSSSWEERRFHMLDMVYGTSSEIAYKEQ